MSSYSILIIDDDESTHDVLGEYLSLAGFTVFGARDGAVGVQMIEEKRPDLALLDVNMPVMDGFKAMEMIFANKELKDTPVIFVTSLDRYNLKIKGLELGAEDYIIKPFHRAELLARVKAALRRGGRYRRNENAMHGSLLDMCLAELLQTLDIGRKTACIHLPDISGCLCTSAGTICHASFRNFRGVDAVMRLFLLEHGSFYLKFGPPDSGVEIHNLPIQSTLFETVTYIDELRAIIRTIAEDNVMLEMQDAVAFPEIDRLKSMFPCRLYDLIAMMDGDMKENAGKVGSALRENKLLIIQ